MTRTAAEAVLRNAPLGTFLLRYKSNDNTYAISLKYVLQRLICIIL